MGIRVLSFKQLNHLIFLRASALFLSNNLYNMEQQKQLYIMGIRVLLFKQLNDLIFLMASAFFFSNNLYNMEQLKQLL